MSGVQHKAVSEDEEGMRLDRWFNAHFPEVKHGRLEKMLRKGEIRVGGGRVKANRRLEIGEEIRIPPLGEPRADHKKTLRVSEEGASKLREMIIFEDDHLIALNKPFGLAVQGGAKTFQHVDGMLGALGEGEARPKLVHRLDKDTGGLLLVAKTRKAAQALSDGFKTQKIQKTYWALVAGAPELKEGTINLPIAQQMVRHKEGQTERVIPDGNETGKRAETMFQTVESLGPISFLAMKPITGRKHQLRVHAAAMECPIIGDGKYGGDSAQIEGVSNKMHLFCRSMTFKHPATGRMMTLSADLTGHMKTTWAYFNFETNPKIEWPEL